MDNPSMNIGPGGIEQDRTINNVGFNGNFHVNTNPPTTKPMTPYDLPAPLVNMVNESSNSQQIDVGPSAHDKTMGGM